MDGAVTTDDASYGTLQIPVEGGQLHAGVWGPADGPTVLAVHGITASHRCWPWLAAARPDVRLVAVDLRGRGRSNGLPGPYGLRRHAADVVAVAESLDTTVQALVGHSMGAFVAALAAASRPGLAQRTVLVDGGLPLAAPSGTNVAEAVRIGLGPALARLSMTFTDQASYRSFWREHPALGGQAGPELDAYADYDLEPAPGGWRSRVRAEAVQQDSADQFEHELIMDALRRLPSGTTLLTAPRGLLGTPPPLYPPEYRDRLLADLPNLSLDEVPDVNHYTIVMGPAVRHLAADLP